MKRIVVGAAVAAMTAGGALAQGGKGAALEDASYAACYQFCESRAQQRGLVGRQVAACAELCVKNRTERNRKRQQKAK
jgi:hypothetical protein